MPNDVWTRGGTPPANPNGRDTATADRPAQTPGRKVAEQRRPVAPAAPPYALRTHRPSGVLSGCLILLEGGEYAGKTTEAVMLTASPRVGRSFFLPLGVGEEHEVYGAIPNVRLEIIDHGGTWDEIVAVVRAVAREAHEAKRKGEPPVVLIIDSMTHLWRLLSNWAKHRARQQPANQRLLEKFPDADPNVGALLWDAATKRHQDLVSLLISMPAIVIVTARGRDVMAVDETGQPATMRVDGRTVPVRDYKVEAQKDLAFSTTAWVRMSRDGHPTIIGARLPDPRAAVLPHDPTTTKVINPDAEPFKSAGIRFSLEWLIFEVLKVDPRALSGRPAVELKMGEADTVDAGAPSPAPEPVDGADEQPGRPTADEVLTPKSRDAR